MTGVFLRAVAAVADIAGEEERFGGGETESIP